MEMQLSESACASTQKTAFPWLSKRAGLFRGCLLCATARDRLDWNRARKVPLVAFGFHGNFNCVWMRALERRFPGRSAGAVTRKLQLDQTAATSVFYVGMSFLEGKEDILQDWREKFLNTYKTGLMYWPFVQCWR
ncbi:LOW QUALITY PROTEIN: mpv17-like protein [Amia ocellicauda]|uniref:LOW QUALITY PROTEIN: mpv17-like protein n=1 Tax=Amia ocellicauda TaxID=2972642 RepID=UPI00346441F7